MKETGPEGTQGGKAEAEVATAELLSRRSQPPFRHCEHGRDRNSPSTKSQLHTGREQDCGAVKNT